MTRLLVLVACLFTAASAGAESSAPPLRGVPLIEPTGLRLLVPAHPPFVLDVDTGGVKRLAGLDVRDHPVLAVSPAGKDAVVWLDRATRGRKLPSAEIYVVRHGGAKATLIARGWDVAPNRGGRALWVKSYTDARHCSLRKLGLNGRRLAGPRAISCSVRLVDVGGGALLIRGSDVADPATGRTVFRTSGLWAVGGRIRAQQPLARWPDAA